MVYACSVYNCAKQRETDSNISLHKLPRDSIMRDRWIEVMRCENFEPTQYTKICSKHFTPDSYVTNSRSSIKRLKKDAVPSIFDFPNHLMTRTTPRKLPTSKLQPQNIEIENEDESDEHTVIKNDKAFAETPVKKKRTSYVGDFKKLFYSTDDDGYQIIMNNMLTTKQEQIRKLQQYNRQLLKRVSNLNTSLKNLKRQQMIDNNSSLELSDTIPVARNASKTDEFDDYTLDSIDFSTDSEKNSFENFPLLKEKSTNCIYEEKNNIEIKNNFQVENENDTLDQSKTHDSEHEDIKRYLAQLMIIKQKWEEIKLKKDLLQKELYNSYTEDNIEKLSRILNEKENNSENVPDYLKQKDIVIIQLKDQDIISLYENHNIASMYNKLPDLIDENPSMHSLGDDNLFDCDYCPQIFSNRDTLEVHLKSHDYKIFYFCDDCGSEFANIDAKQAHEITCIKKLICRYCDITLNTKEKKRQHEQNHCDTIFGQICDMCGNKFKYQGTLNQHIKTQHTSWKNVFECPECSEIFAFKQQLNNHLKLFHTPSLTYLCEECGADFKNLSSLRHHQIRNHQSTDNERKSSVCDKLLSSYKSSKHKRIHNKPYTIQCPHCDKMFKNTSTLKPHVILHEDQQQYFCDTCGVGFNHHDELRLHMNIHKKSDSSAPEDYSCQICSEKFPNNSMLVSHRNEIHRNDKHYTCHICYRLMMSMRSLEWHMLYIHNEKPTGITLDDSKNSVNMERHSCIHCDKTFKTAKILITHIKNIHLKNKIIQCLDCGLNFKSKIRLRYHMMAVHNRLKGTTKCSQCSKRFLNQSRLKVHMISHSKEQPYMCEICGTRLKTKIHLLNHHQNQHGDDQPLQCRYCECRFKQMGALVNHERIHINEQPYSCIICEQRFKSFDDKKRHEEGHENRDGAGSQKIVADGNVENSKNQDEQVPKSENDLLEQEYQAIDDHLTDQHNEYDSQYDVIQTIEFDEQKIDNENQDYIQELNQEHIQDIQQEIDEEIDNIAEHEYIDEIGLYDDEEENLEHQQWQHERETEINNDYEQKYKHEYELLPGEAFEVPEVIMNMEDETVYSEEVMTDNIENVKITTNHTVQTESSIHIQQ
ncbi:hypothetical protein PV327_009427 [Microctonus hyperodae]|uniref:Uncharacterized protein n=1 Tax=Microctonus hyperodae TaxID=165561 RepID=A0AA39FU12_MICHY|nr:hypothetical protein PV327_009427 [Microctonus hyperodae]